MRGGTKEVHSFRTLGRAESSDADSSTQGSLLASLGQNSNLENLSPLKFLAFDGAFSVAPDPVI